MGKLNEMERLLIVDAIGEAERGSRGEVRLHLEERCAGDALVRARELFAQLGMAHTHDDTGVLLYVATTDRKVAVFAGSGIHGATEPAFWAGVADEVASGFARGRGVSGLVKAIERVGDTLRQKCPADDRHGDELPNQISGHDP